MDFSLFSLLLLCSSLCIAPSLSDPRSSQAALICGNHTALASDRATFVANFVGSMNALTPLITSQRYAVVRQGTGNNTVYAFGECMRDLNQNDCELCFSQCKTNIPRCLPFQRLTRSGRNYLDGCYLRYDSFDFFQQFLSSEDSTKCSNQTFHGKQKEYESNAMKVVRNLTIEAPKHDGFAVTSSGEKGNTTVYGLAQCWRTVNRSSCQRCLTNASSTIKTCFSNSKLEGRVMNAGCYMRYSNVRFFFNSTATATNQGKVSRRKPIGIILAISSCVLAVSLLLVTGFYYGRTKLQERRKVRKQLGALARTIGKSNLNFHYEALEKATNYFHSSNKLGQGGSGSVFKGVLADGKTVAVKRLFFNTRQWVDQFFNEVNLVSNIHHKNLVRLLGCSITGPESLLVYEYVPNKNLHEHIFGDKTLGKELTWDKRFNIIVGIAEGLAYLHEESKARIIHRDIKLGNILLDENFNAKIADFGHARFFPEDKTHMSTGIAGTLGYMAPEYLIRGKLTEKVDVYSFGVVVIEVVTGKRNYVCNRDKFPLLQMIWNLYMSNRLVECVDESLEGAFQDYDIQTVLQIGLLCTQASVELRPAMSTVVKMLTDNYPIPSPTQPPFLKSNGEISSLPRETCSSQQSSHASKNSMTTSLFEPR